MQGLGFVVFGQVITRRTLWIALSDVYGVMVAFGPTFLGEVDLSAGGAGAQHANCPFGWTHADNLVTDCQRLCKRRRPDELAVLQVSGSLSGLLFLTWCVLPGCLACKSTRH